MITIDNKIKIVRDKKHGYPIVEADELKDLFKGLGYCHAMDRGLHLLMMRILGQGRASELLQSTDELLEVDKFFRKMNWSHGLDEEISKLDPDILMYNQKYCEGINEYFAKKYPFEFKLMKYKPEEWTIHHTLLLARMTGFLTMAQTQGEVEKLIVQMVQAGVEREFLYDLFPYLPEGFDLNSIKDVKVEEKIVPDEVKWMSSLTGLSGSNNWVVSGKRTETGKPLLSNDPHLEINRLPNVWYELVMKTNDRYFSGFTIPGICGLLIGRNNDLSWGTTYTFMDAVDSWMEECKDGKYLKDDQWHQFNIRTEEIKRKGKKAELVTFYENDHGVVEGNPELNGKYLTSKWSSSVTGANSLKAGAQMWFASNSKEGMETMGLMELSFSWVFADKLNNIGFQMSGLMPERAAGNNGMVPFDGTKSSNDWKGWVSYQDLPSLYNPDNGYIITANHNLNYLGNSSPINCCMADYRAKRIEQLLVEQDQVSIQNFMDMHYDLHSLQAEKFMAFISPLLGETANEKTLKQWDLQYDKDSKGAYLFEKLYIGLIKEVFGGVLGSDVMNYLVNETGILIDFYNSFDGVLLNENSVWFRDKSRDECIKKVIKEVLVKTIPVSWGSVNKVLFKNIFFDGKLPKFLGFDKGFYPLQGSRATIHQGQIYKSAGRESSFAPSVRIIADMSNDNLFTNIAGGPSDRRFSKWYVSDLKNWQSKKYKKITP
jgi:penicillin amidase